MTMGSMMNRKKIEKSAKKSKPKTETLSKRVLILSDFHCGHRAGLTPPEFQTQIPGKKYFYITNETWDLYKKKIKQLGPIHTLIINGDAIEGLGRRSGGSELLTNDMKTQCAIAERCINEVKAKNIIMLRGTPYHSSPEGQDWEDIIAKNVNAKKISDHEWLDINGTIFDIRHHVAGTSTPHKGTPLTNQQLANLMWAEREGQPKGNVIIRSHVHNFFFCGANHWLGITTPALQAAGSKFGARKCNMPVDWGFVWFDCYKGGKYSWDRFVVNVKTQVPKTLKL